MGFHHISPTLRTRNYRRQETELIGGEYKQKYEQKPKKTVVYLYGFMETTKKGNTEVLMGTPYEKKDSYSARVVSEIIERCRLHRHCGNQGSRCTSSPITNVSISRAYT